MKRFSRFDVLCFIFISLNSLLFLVSCSNHSNKTEAEKEQINRLDTSIVVSSLITDFLPNNVKKHNDVSQFLNSYVEVGDKFYSHFYENLNNQAKLEENVSDMNEANNEGDDVVKIFKSTRKSFKELKNTTKGAIKSVWAAKDLLTLEEKRSELINKYSTTVVDSFQFAEKAVDKYLYYSYVNPYQEEMKKIKSFNSIRSMPTTFTSDQIKELNIDKTLENFIELQKSGNEIRKVLVFNKISGKEYSDLIKFQIDEISAFWESNSSDYENGTKLFQTFSSKLVDFKADLKEKKRFSI